MDIHKYTLYAPITWYSQVILHLAYTCGTSHKRFFSHVLACTRLISGFVRYIDFPLCFWFIVSLHISDCQQFDVPAGYGLPKSTTLSTLLRLCVTIILTSYKHKTCVDFSIQFLDVRERAGFFLHLLSETNFDNLVFYILKNTHSRCESSLAWKPLCCVKQYDETSR